MRYPEITVQLTGEDGNAFNVLGRVQRAMRAGGLEQAVIDEYLAEATEGDYNDLLVTTMHWVDVL